jgi:uncharacterized protein (DUF2062 family)
MTLTMLSLGTCFIYPMRQAAVAFSIVLAVVCIYWTYDYIRRRSRMSRRRRRDRR